jgi:hypothetical protein
MTPTSPLMLFETVPLVPTNKLGAFFSGVPIPHHYGDLTRSRVRGTKVEPGLYLIAGHPCLSVEKCFVDNGVTQGFEALVRPDVDGVTRQYVRLTAPSATDDPIVEVCIKGKMNPLTGRLLENPDEIIEDIAKLCGRVLRFPLFREQCNLRSLRVAGSVYEARSLRSYVNEIVTSVGAEWLGDNAIFYPPATGYARPVVVNTMTCDVAMTDVAGVIQVFYGWNHSQERNGNFVELTATGCQYTNKGVFYARWLRSPRDAEALARRILAKRAGDFVTLTATIEGRAHAGEVVLLEDRNFSGETLVLSATPSEVDTQITGEIILTPAILMEVTQYSSENLAVRSERIDVLLDRVTLEATITIFDQQNRPMEGVKVTYDGTITKTTDTAGIVVFSVTRGNHTLILEGEKVSSSEPYPLIIP